MVTLLKHQIEAVEFLVERKGVGAIYYGCGTGKTLLTIEAFRQLGCDKMVVICPLTLIKNAWLEDTKKHGEFQAFSLRSSNNWGYSNGKIFLLNFEMLYQKKTVDWLRGLANKHKTVLVIDESSRMKNPTSQTTKTILSLADFFPCRVLLSGTPAPNSETEYWSQMKFLDRTIFDKNFYMFRSQFFHLKRGNQTMPCWGYTNPDLLRKGWKHAISVGSRKALVERMKPHVIFRELKDCVDLPEQTHITRRFDLCDEQQQSYDSMRDDMVAEIQEQMIAANMALTKLTKLRQITSGFMHDTGEGKTYDYKTNAKLEEMSGLIEEIGNHQVIIWTWFRHEANVISNFLGHKSAIVNGTLDEHAKQNNIDGFRDGRIQYLIANPLSIAHGLTLTNCHYAIYYSLSYSWEQLSQSLARIHRMSQKNPCIYYYLLANNTIDEVVHETLKNKGDAEDIVKGLINQRGRSGTGRQSL